MSRASKVSWLVVERVKDGHATTLGAASGAVAVIGAGLILRCHRDKLVARGRPDVPHRDADLGRRLEGLGERLSVEAAAALAGFSLELQGGYPGWKPEPGASLVRLVDAVHAERFGRPMAVRALHAGLECGIIGEKYPGLEMVSFGPDEQTMAVIQGVQGDGVCWCGGAVWRNEPVIRVSVCSWRTNQPETSTPKPLRVSFHCFSISAGTEGQ